MRKRDLRRVTNPKKQNAPAAPQQRRPSDNPNTLHTMNTPDTITTPAALPDFSRDIPADLALAAHSGCSFVPERRAESTRREYAATMAADYLSATTAARTPEAAAEVSALFDAYRAGYAKRYRAYLASRSRCVSSMIAGPSNFPAARMAKRGDIAHSRLTELIEYRNHMIAKMARAARPDLRPIMTGDADAIARLENKLAALVATQERMKAANAAIRKHAKAGPAAQLAALVALGYAPDRAAKILAPDFAGRTGFPSFEITNNGANIRRVEKQLAAARALKTETATEAEGTAARLEDCPQENRVRLFFPGKPSAETIAELKRNAFRWTPSLTCWQAYRTSLPAARRLAGMTA